ncbi:hypothetical protein [Zoogloea sp.]|uniref:hypothetical protein n=1 Tax=Zoogloea sp. TaxID=49181 RepID=UPI0026006BD7|nr:hypothetical protein [Zoogloea sp.]MCK6394472.1 hypothetical protein [Zoogloea sp.]
MSEQFHCRAAKKQDRHDTGGRIRTLAQASPERVEPHCAGNPGFSTEKRAELVSKQ